ncbi:uncharacterized protein LOC131267276 isoform X2 [Anopheles coustani]|uniref:uncharacterized protein LOC131267276 isoform X2 n=1 Tax=Anopheles coustani TaxID=139045 RepID=UPI0026584EC3|nr:uncharacterized protein LOC131267276 isoform X2 [Anopheles coustani]
MSNPSTTLKKDVPRMDDKYTPSSREKGSNDREYPSHYRRWSTSGREPYSPWSRSGNWRYEQNRDRYPNRHWPYHSQPYRYGDRDGRSYSSYGRGGNTRPHSSSTVPHESECRPADGSNHPQPGELPPVSSLSMPTNFQEPVRRVSKDMQPADDRKAKEDLRMNMLVKEKIKTTFSGLNVSPLRKPMMDTHNALISKLIADEAIKMLSSAASSRAPTSLNEPSEESGSIRSPTSGSSNDLPPAGSTTTTKPANKAQTFAADSALLQKSAEQVTRKLINQLTTMSKYNLKQMIDNPAGKYETALNKHAQNKLRAEVRKQLKNFTLADAVRAKERNFGSDALAPDEAIDAEKIPAALLEQIGHALDLDFFDLASSEARDSAEADSETVIIVEDDNQPSAADKPAAEAVNNQDVNLQDKENGISSSFASDKTQATEDAPHGLNNVFPVAIFPSQHAAIIPAEEPGNQTLISNQMQPWKIGSFLHVNTVYELNKRLETNTNNVGQTGQTPRQMSLPTNGTQIIQTNSTALSNGNEIANDSHVKSPSDFPGTGANTTSLVCLSKHGTNIVLPSMETPKRNVKPTKSVAAGGKKIPQLKPLASNANASFVAEKQTNIMIQIQPSVPTQRTPPVAGTTQNTMVDHSIVSFGDNEQPSPTGKKKQKKKNKKKSTQSPVPEGNSNGNATITSPKPKTNPKPGTGTSKSLPWSNSRWVVTGVTPELVPGENSSLRIKSPEPIPISSRSSPHKEGANYPKGQCNSNGKRSWNGSPPGNKNQHQPFKAKYGGSPKGKQKLWHGAKKPRGPEAVTPTVESSKEPNTSETNIQSIRHEEASQRIALHPVIGMEPNPTNQEKMVFPTLCSEPHPTQPIIVNATNSKEQNGNQANTLQCEGVNPSTENFTHPSNCKEVNPCEENVVPTQNSNDKKTREENTVRPQLENASDIRISEVRSLAENENNNMTIADASAQPSEAFKTIPLVEPTAHTEAQVSMLNEGVQLSTPCPSERFLNHPVPSLNHLFPTEQPDLPTTMLPELMSSSQQQLVMILNRMQSIDAQTVELFKRKMEIDGQIMKLNGERMEIDQEIVKLQNAREAQMNTLRIAMFIPQNAPAAVSNSSNDNQPHPLLTVRTDLISTEVTKNVISSSEQESREVGPAESPTENMQQQSAVNQERTIRRITKISGNSDLMRIFQRRRLLSDRSSDDNGANETGATPLDLPTV